MKIVKWDPFKHVMMVDDYFDPNEGQMDRPRTWSPAVDVYETDKDIVLTAELPGVHQEDISLMVHDNMLTLKGDRRFERDVKQENFYRIERNYGFFCRKFTMPCEVENDKISAVF
jgi:HSP20 family protein